MGTGTHATTDHSHEHAGPHPELPEIIDDAPPTADWLPWTGLCLLLVLVIVGLAEYKMRPIEAAPTTENTAAEPTAAPEAAPADAQQKAAR